MTLDDDTMRQAFARALSHDFASLLRSARQLSAYAREDIVREDADAAMHALGMLDLRLAGMDRFVGDLIRFSRAGQRQPDYEQFSLSELAEMVFRKQCAHSNARLSLAIDQDQVVADLVTMRTVFDELFRNAIVHHPEPADLVLHVETSQALGNNATMLAISDNGKGVPDNMLGRIVNPFVKLSSGRNTPGLGLAVIERELAAMGARLQFRSARPGLAAVITLPDFAELVTDPRRPAIEPLDSAEPPRLRLV